MTDEKRKELLDMFLYDDGNRTKISQMIIENLPKYLYKYRSGNPWDLDALENNQLWMGNATLMDDPYDSKFLLTDKFRAQIEYVVNNVEHFKKPKYQRHLRDDSIQRECYLCSLSEIDDSEDMWMRYANNEQGFCIQYNTVDLINKVKFPILPVWYGEKTYEDVNSLSKMSKPAIIMKNFLIKDRVGSSGEDWYSQREWRIVAFQKMLGITDDISNGKCIDAIKPTKIILGKNVSAELSDRIIKWVNKQENPKTLIEKR